jgi:uncharacterized damage-inducible protein DinB
LLAVAIAFRLTFHISREDQLTMRRIVLVLALAFSFTAQAQTKNPATLKSILLEQLRTTHNQKDWFVDANTAVAGLTPEQASWKDNSGTHSVGQLTVHLIFWDKQNLAKFKGEDAAKYSGNNEETFNSFDAKKWSAAVKELDEVLADWEKAVEAADEKKLEQWAPIIARIGTHNAYHIGQIVFIRKTQGWWDAEKGVK